MHPNMIEALGEVMIGRGVGYRPKPQVENDKESETDEQA